MPSMDASAKVSQSVEVGIGPVTAYDEAAGEGFEIQVSFGPTPAGTLVTIDVRGWERLPGGAEIGRGYGEGAKELLSWYAEAAAAG